MHELSIALNIIDLVEEECLKAGSSVVTEVTLRVGTLSGVDPVALSTCLQVASRDSLMKEARIRLEREPGKGWCRLCAREFEMEDILDLCPRCFQPATELRTGQEMQVESIMVE